MDHIVTENAMPSSAPAPVGVRAEFPLRAFFGHHKCATGWIDSILMEICFHMGIRFKMVHMPAHFQDYGTLGTLVRRQRVDFLAYTNANRDHISDLALYRGFHVVRDPRDVLVSAYYSHLYSHGTKDWPALEAHRNELKGCSKEEGLFCEMEFSRQEFEEMYRWDYQQAHVLELKMEDLIADPVEGFLNIARFLEILSEDNLSGIERLARTVNLKMNRLSYKGRRIMPGRLPMFLVPWRRLHAILLSVLEKIVQKKSFKRLSGGRKRGQENVRSHYRKGVPGDWRNHLNEEHVRIFKKNYNDLLVKLGYESDGNW